MKTSEYHPKPSTATISNAMDVGDPSNFVRILRLYGDDFKTLGENLSSYSFTDAETREGMKALFNHYGYVSDPHGAVGFLGLKKYREEHPAVDGIFLETAHPVKFLDVVRTTLKTEIPLPPQILEVINRDKEATPIASYEDLKGFLLA